MLLRLVAVLTERGWMYLLTNEWKLTNRQIGELYQARWGIDLLQQAMRELLSSHCHTELDFTACLQADESNRTTSKQNRDYPRKKQPPSCGPPNVKTATKQQIARAREFL